MAALITSRQFGARQTFRPMLGAAPSLSTIQNVAPASVPPEKVSQIPVSTEEANKARKTYLLSVNALEGWASKDLQNIEVADWDQTMSRVVPRIIGEYNTLVQQVRGRTGDSDSEYALELQWWGLWTQAYQANKSRPSDLAQAAASFIRFLGDFKEGVKSAWQDYSDWAITHAGPVLRKYHDALEHLAKLDANLLEATSSGKVSDGDLFNQSQAIARAREGMENAASLYKTLSAGGDLNAIAVREFGPVLAGWQITAAQAAVISAVSVAIIYAVAAVLSVNILTDNVFAPMVDGAKEAADNFWKAWKDNPVGTTAIIGFVLGMVALPFALFRSKEVIVQQPRIETP
jgi:hypothetical protein